MQGPPTPSLRAARTPYRRHRTYLIVATTLMLLATPAVFGTPSTPPVVPPAAPPVHSEAPVLPASAGSGLLGRTVSTLSLFNHSLVAGIANPADPTHGYGLAYDGHHGEAWVTAGNFVGAVNVTQSLGVRWVAVGTAPRQLAFDNRSGVLFVANTGSNNVTAINTTTCATEGAIPVGSSPYGIAYDWQNDRLYVANSASNNVTIVNATSMLSTGSVVTGMTPQGVVFDPTLSEVFVANRAGGNLTIIDASTGTVAGNVSLSPAVPQNLAYDGTRLRVYVTGVGGGIGVVNPATRKLIATIHVGIQINSLALGLSDVTLYATDGPTGILYAVNTSSLLASAHLGIGMLSTPTSVLYVPVGDQVYVVANDGTNAYASNITVVSESTFSTVGTVGLESYPSAVLSIASRHSVYVYDGGTGFVNELNGSTGQVNRSLFIGYSPISLPSSVGLAYNPAGGQLYADFFNVVSGGIVSIGLASFNLIKSVPDPYGPSGLAYDPVEGHLFVAHQALTNVSVLYGSNLTTFGAVNVGAHPTGVLYDPGSAGVYVTNGITNNVTVVRAADDAVVGSVPVGNGPLGITYDRAHNAIYVANANSNNLSIISDRTNSTIGTVVLPGSGAPTGVAYDAPRSAIVVSIDQSAGAPGSVDVVNDSNGSFVANATIGHQPRGVATDPSSGITFAANQAEGTVSLVTWTILYPPLVFQSFNATPSNLTLGNGSLLAVSVQGGTPPLHYAYSTLPPGCVGADAALLACIPSATGNFTIGVNVSDGANHTVSGVTRLAVHPIPYPALVVGLTITPVSIVLGDSVAFTTSVTGGDPPYHFWFTGLPPGCATQDTSGFVCVPSAVGNSSVTVQVNDTSGVIATAVASLEVRPLSHPPPSTLLIVSFSASPSTLHVGDSVSISVNVTGGFPPYTYLYSNLPTGCGTTNRSTWDCVPTAAFNRSIDVRVTDSNRSVVNSSTPLTVIQQEISAPPPPTYPWLWVAAGAVILLAAVVAAVALVRWRRRGRKKPDPTSA